MSAALKNPDSVIARYVRRARLATGLNQQRFGEEVGRTKANVSAWENGRHEPSWDLLQRIQSVSGVEMPVVGVEPRLTADGAVHPYAGKAGSTTVAEHRRQGRVPLISWQQAGHWAELAEQLTVDDARHWFACPFAHGKRSFVLQVVGDGMFDPAGEKSYRNGDFIVVDPDRTPGHGSVIVLRLPGQRQATFRQLLSDPDGRRWLKALNPEWPDRIIELPRKPRIAGVVIGKWVAE